MSTVFIIDDDPIHQKIAQMIIGKNHLFDYLESYTQAGFALDYIRENRNNAEALPDVILLDLNMPEIDGWMFLDFYEELESSLARISKIFIVSSSIDETDKSRAAGYPFVKGFISKPISTGILTSFLKEKNLTS